MTFKIRENILEDAALAVFRRLTSFERDRGLCVPLSSRKVAPNLDAIADVAAAYGAFDAAAGALLRAGFVA